MKRNPSSPGGYGRPNEPAVLILTGLASGPKHGYALSRDIEEFAGVRLGPGTLYGAITRLEERGLIEPVGRAPTARRLRPDRITASGQAALTEAVRDMARWPMWAPPDWGSPTRRVVPPHWALSDPGGPHERALPIRVAAPPVSPRVVCPVRRRARRVCLEDTYGDGRLPVGVRFSLIRGGSLERLRGRRWRREVDRRKRVRSGALRRSAPGRWSWWPEWGSPRPPSTGTC